MERGTPARAWVVVGLWSLGIFAAIPLGRRAQVWVSETVGRDAFLYFVFGFVAIGVLWALWALAKASRGLSTANVIGCLLVGGCFMYASWEKRQAPEEALHFVQYGVLGILVFRALRHSIRDSLIYVIAILTCVGVGLLDEFVQWLTPGRFFGFGDIRMNASAAALSQLGIAIGVSPADISWRPTRRSALVAIDLALALIAAFALCASNTPAAVNWYASRIPPLAFLAQNESIMSEFGYLHVVPDVGRFYSRLSLEELRQQDRDRASRAASTLDAYRAPERYGEFLETYTAGRDPFLHEARVHMFSRDWHIWAVGAGVEDAGTDEEHWTIAYRENQLLERFFPETLKQSSYALTEDERESVEQGFSPEIPFTSRTSAELVTRVGLVEVLLGLGAAAAALIVLRQWLRRKLAVVG